MNIELQHTGDLTATVKIDISPADYEDNVMKVLKDYQRKAQMPGFRQGKVPFGLTKKMYGQAVMADEVNKLLGESLEKFIDEQKLDILGNPLANTEKTPQIDFTGPVSTSFYFDLGFSPKFELNLGDIKGISYYRIEVSDEIAGKYLEDMRRRNGEPGEVEVSESGDLLKGDFSQLDANGDPLEGGISTSGSIDPSLFSDEEVRKSFEGKKVGETIRINPMKASGNATDVAAMLGITKETAAGLDSEFNFVVSSITRMIPAEVNAEFFEKVYPGVEIADEAGLIEQIKADAASSFVGESDRKFFNDAVKAMIETADINLPDEFLKRWLVDVNREKLTAEEVEKNYDSYAQSMRWQLIENRMIHDHGISVSEEEIRNVFRGYFGRPGGELDEDMKKRIETIVDSFMKNKDDVRRINDQLFEQKLLALLKEKITLDEKVVSYDDFVKLASVQE